MADRRVGDGRVGDRRVADKRVTELDWVYTYNITSYTGGLVFKIEIYEYIEGMREYVDIYGDRNVRIDNLIHDISVTVFGV